MSFLKKLFGGSGAETPAKATAESYKDYSITPTPIREGTAYRVSARIEKQIDDETKIHTLVRADTIGDLSQAEATSIAKAKQMIDEQGDRIFR
ncbi:MAG: HlyU family transcriptional regulator [Tateyamaria sp.]|uniref:HlyU family transcriptional regulator n=1 Tax=Tateyamaria sp. TaxID=1929288 RepID=UPI00326A19F9